MTRPRLVALCAIALVVFLLAAGVWLYPIFARYLQKQDCIAQGYTSCVQ